MNWTDKRGEPLSRFPGFTNGAKREGKVMKSIKEHQKQAADVKESLDHVVNYMNDLMIYSIACRLMIERGDTSFPPTKEDHDYILTVLSECDKEEGKYEESEDEAASFASNNPVATIRHIDITDKKSFASIIKICSYLSIVVSCPIYYPDKFPVRSIENILFWCGVAAGKVYELSGYWTAKMEGKKRTPGGGAKAMEERGKANAEAIKKIIAELGVRQLSVFRQDKKLRESFYDKAKIATYHGAPLSEDRISKIARALLQG
jgi:hypothetical protein